MSETTGPALASKPDENNHANDSAVLDYADAAFLGLVHDLELYIEDILLQPVFHRFLDLPTELRYKIYEEYFLDNGRALTTQVWPDFYWSRYELRMRASAPFLPSLCMARKTLLSEVGVFLLASIWFQFYTMGDLMRFLDAAAHFQTSELNIAHNIRRLVIQDANNLSFAQVSYFNGQKTERANMAMVEFSNRSTSVALNICQGLRDLCVTFYAPVEIRFSHTSPSESPQMTALSIGSYLDGFNLKSVLRLRSLRRFTLVGISGRENLCRHTAYDIEKVNIKRDTIECLRPLSELGNKIKKGFRSRNQQVEVHTYLYWGEDEEEEKVVE